MLCDGDTNTKQKNSVKVAVSYDWWSVKLEILVETKRLPLVPALQTDDR